MLSLAKRAYKAGRPDSGNRYSPGLSGTGWVLGA